MGIEPIRGQTIVLRWAAAEAVHVSDVNFGKIAEFDAATVSSSLMDDTVELQDLIADIVREDFGEFDVTVLTTEDELPEGPHSTVFFGTSELQQGILGMADDVDFYNADDTDDAIILLDSFAGIANLQAAAQAIGNVVSHEIGHLLGLLHTKDVTTLMDSTGDAISLLSDQSFGVADILVFPIGMQNAPLLLEATVGRAASQAPAGFGDGLFRCGTCGATLSGVLGSDAVPESG